MRINHNTGSISTMSERLSSGYRINKSKDDSDLPENYNIIIRGAYGNTSTIHCLGPNYKKVFTLYNKGETEETVSLNLMTSNSAGTRLSERIPNNFSINPCTSKQLLYDNATITIPSKEYASFSISCKDPSHLNFARLNIVGNVSPFSAPDDSFFTSTIVDENGDIFIDTTHSITFVAYNKKSLYRRELGSILRLDSDNKHIISSSEKNISDDTFGLIRTNPKLTGNVKITIDSLGEIWLNSIDASKELSDDRFKKYKIHSNSSYAVDIKNFFDRGKMPSDVVFQLYEKDTLYTSTKRTLEEQYDRFYQYGAEFLINKFYEESFSFFAPIYIKKQIPEYFVIFRTEGPINRGTYINNEISIEEILQKSSIIKTYNLQEDSKIGKYIRNIIEHPSRKNSELTVSFQRDGYTSFNGISYKDGSFAQKGELLYDYFSEENPILLNEEFLTLGFERNGILSSNILNLEFLFDDIEVEQYSINRYFGLYVNAIDLAKFDLNENGFIQYNKETNQTPIPRKGNNIIKTNTKQYIQKNDSGVCLYCDVKTIENKSVHEKIFTSAIISQDQEYIHVPGNITSNLNENDDCKLLLENDRVIKCKIEKIFYKDNITYISVYDEDSSFLLRHVKSIDFYDKEKFENYKLNPFKKEYIQSQRLYYIRDNTNNFISIKDSDIIPVSIDSFNVENAIKLTLKKKEVDISRFTGFEDISTQTVCELLKKGSSSIYVEILNKFNPNDFIEIKINDTQNINGYPLRWKVIANSTLLNPGESWASSGISKDENGEFYFSYFHPGEQGTSVNDIAQGIQSAFNRFIFRNFDVVNKNGVLYFKSNEKGLISENISLSFYTANKNISIMKTPPILEGSVKFIGASDRNNTRAKISQEISMGILENEYISTEGSFSRIKKYNILGNNIVFAPYLDEPVYDRTNSIIDFKNSEKYHTIVIENESQPIQLTYDNKLTTYECFKPYIGILSIFQVKDFDLDFHSSDYSRNYLPELKEYFSREFEAFNIRYNENEQYYEFKTDIFDTKDIIFPQKLFFLDLAASPPDLVDGHFIFETSGLTASFESNIENDTRIFTKVLPISDDKLLYFKDKQLSKFKGLLSLSSIITPENEAEYFKLEKEWNPLRFIMYDLDCEYDRLYENLLKTLCLKSRVVPYITKWVHDDGKDIRDNNYRLNWNRAFGTMNFSPSLHPDSDPKFHTHEWAYLDHIPHHIDIEEYLDHAFSYCFDKIDEKYDFSSTEMDWFSVYFNTGFPTECKEGDSINIERSKKYSIFKYEDFSNKTFTLFRGQRIEIVHERTPEKYNNYKFSVIISSKSINYNENEEPISFNTIVNEKWKFILIVININISDYKYPMGDISYTDLYTLGSSEYIGIINDFKIVLPCDYRLSTPINFASFSDKGMNYFDICETENSYVTDLREEIRESVSGYFNRLCAVMVFDKIDTSISIFPPLSNHIDSDKLRIEDKEGNIEVFIKHGYNDKVSKSYLPSGDIEWDRFNMYHENGGLDSLEGIRNRLSFFEISKVLTNTSNKNRMNFKIYGDDYYSEEPDFSFDIIQPETLQRYEDYIPLSDSDKPSCLMSYDIIGSILEPIENSQTLYRYQGNFNPKFKDVLKFWLRETEEFTIDMNKDFLLCNTHFGTNIAGFGFLKNQYFNKVSSDEILSISSVSGYLPVYPLTGEISIDKKDECIWNSSWDNNYFRFYSDKQKYKNVRGLDIMKEVKSFFGSKCMKVPEFFDLHEFSVEQTDDFNISNKEIAYKILDDTIILRVNLYERLLREMLEGNEFSSAKLEFLKLSDIIENVDELAQQYLEKNIINLYEIDNIKLYTLNTGNPGDNQISMINDDFRPVIETYKGFSLDENILFNKQYKIQKDVNIINNKNMIFEIKYALDNRYYTSVSLGVSIKRI